MERKYVYIIVLLLSITFGISYNFVNKSLDDVNYLNTIDNNNAINGLSINDQEETITYTEFTISNTQNDKTNITYKYNIKIDSVSGAHKYMKNDKESGYIVFAANGVASISLKNNEKITIYDVPSTGSYSITQETNSRYKTYISNIETNVASGIIANNNSVTFDNVLISNNKPIIDPDSVEEKEESKEETENNESEQKPEKNPTTKDYIFIPIAALLTGFVLLVVSSIRLIIYNKRIG